MTRPIDLSTTNDDNLMVYTLFLLSCVFHSCGRAIICQSFVGFSACECIDWHLIGPVMITGLDWKMYSSVSLLVIMFETIMQE